LKAEDINKVLVFGAGNMGEGIAQNFAQAGLFVRIVDTDKDALKRCFKQVQSNLALFKDFGLLQEDPSLIIDRIDLFHIKNAAEIVEATVDIDYVVEAIPEVLELKRDLLAKLDSCEDVILASNTSSFMISSISEGLSNPGRVVGLHYFYPAQIIPLVEIHRGKDTHDETIDITRELMVKVGKKPIMVRKEIPGFIVNRIQAAYNREVIHLIEEGVATVEDLDMAAKASYGFRLACFGPLQMHDLNGLDTVLRVGKVTRKTLCNSMEPPRSLVMKVEAGEFGVKSGKGWYDYQGKSRREILEQTNKRLLKQLVLFNTLDKS